MLGGGGLSNGYCNKAKKKINEKTRRKMDNRGCKKYPSSPIYAECTKKKGKGGVKTPSDKPQRIS